jgi:sugar transporter family protein
LLPLLAVVLVLDAFPTYFAPQPAWLRVSAACFAWVAVLGLYISPMRIASWMHGSMDDMEHLAAGALAVSAIPAFCLWVTMMLWSVASLSAPVRGAQVEPVQYGSVRGDAPLGWWGARVLVTERTESVRTDASREATA